MDSTDRTRLMAAGFHIFRIHEYAKTITQCTDAGGWKLHSKYPTKAALHRAWTKLHAHYSSIGD